MMEYDRGYMADTPMLEVRDLTKQYKGFLLDKVSFTLPKGFIMGYVGPNGAGKSTTLGLITKTHRADAGEVLLDGKRYEEDPVSYKEKIGYVSSVSYFRPTMNIKDAVLLLRQFYPTFSKEKFYHYVKAWDLPEKKKFSAFSTGMMVKLMFAAVLSRETRLLILDEATSSIDTRTEQLVQEGMDRLMKGRTTFVIAHRLSTVRNSDCIMVLEQGRIIERGTHDQLMEEKGRYYQLYTGNAIA